MLKVKASSLVDQMKNLVAAVPEIQKMFDDNYEEELKKRDSLLSHYGITENNPLIQALLPTRLKMAKYETDVKFLFSRSKEKGFDVAFRLNGIPVHSFLELRYGISEYQRGCLNVTVETVTYLENQKIKEKKNVK